MDPHAPHAATQTPDGHHQLPPPPPAERPITAPPRRTLSRASLPRRPPTTVPSGQGAPGQESPLQFEDLSTEPTSIVGAKRSAKAPAVVNEKNRREQEVDWARPLLPKDPPPPFKTQIRRRRSPIRKSFSAEEVEAVGALWTQFAHSPAIPETPEDTSAHAGSMDGIMNYPQEAPAIEARGPDSANPAFSNAQQLAGSHHALNPAPAPPAQQSLQQHGMHAGQANQHIAPQASAASQHALPAGYHNQQAAYPTHAQAYQGATQGGPPLQQAPPQYPIQHAVPHPMRPQEYQGVGAQPPLQQGPHANWQLAQQQPMPSQPVATAHVQAPHYHGQASAQQQAHAPGAPRPPTAHLHPQALAQAQPMDQIRVAHHPQYLPQREQYQVEGHRAPLVQPVPQPAAGLQHLHLLTNEHPERRDGATDYSGAGTYANDGGYVTRDGHDMNAPQQPQTAYGAAADQVVQQLLLQLHPALRHQVLASLTSSSGSARREDDAMDFDGPQPSQGPATHPAAAQMVQPPPQGNALGTHPQMRPAYTVARDGCPPEQMEVDQANIPRSDKGKGRATPRDVPAGGSTSQSSQPNLTLLLIDQVQTFREDLQTQSRVQQDLVKAVKGLGQKLGTFEKSPPLSQPGIGQVATPLRKTVRPKRSARASKAMDVRMELARFEQEDFSAEIDAVMSEDEEEPGSSQRKAAQPSPSIRTAKRFGVHGVVPKIPATTPQEEAFMIRAMSKEERVDPERTFILRLQLAVRAHLLYLLKVQSLDDIGKKFPSLTDEELLAYEQAPSPFLNAKNFRIDFKRGWKRCSLNREACSFFVQHFLESVAGGLYRSPPIPSRYFTPTQVELALDSHMTHARTKWKEGAKPAPQYKVDNRAEQKRISSRQKTLYVSRCFVLEIYKLDEHAELLAKLEPRHMSGDESKTPTDRLAGIFVIIEAAWQSDALKTFLRQLDILYAVEFMKPSGGRLRCGKPPRQRIVRPDSRTMDTAAPVGLWRNCYDAKWLDCQRPHFVRGLQIIDEDYNFSLDMDAALNKRNERMDVEEPLDALGSAESSESEL